MIKNEKGSITVFVLCACLLVLVVLIAIFTRNQNKIINQKKELQIIEEKYNADSKIDQIYDETLQNINGGENTTEVVKIATANDLKNFAVSVNNGDTYEGKIVVLMNDIDLSSICSSTNGVSWTPIGNGTTAFSGTFDGRNYTISNLYILTEGGDNQALFRDNNGVIKNLKMQNAYVKSMRNSDTGLYEKYGLLCASNNGEIISCSILSGEFIDSNAGQKYAGGITGYNTGKISKCYNSATNKVYIYGGGIAGYNSGTIESCYNTAIIGNYSDHGGIVGYNYGGTVINCYNIGKVNTWAKAGGIVGTNESQGKIENCYSAGTITTTINQSGASDYTQAGGIVAINSNGTVSNCYYLENTCIGGIGSTTAESSDATGQAEVKTSNELKVIYTTLGGAFKQDTSDINTGYPILSWQ